MLAHKSLSPTACVSAVGATAVQFAVCGCKPNMKLHQKQEDNHDFKIISGAIICGIYNFFFTGCKCQVINTLRCGALNLFGQSITALLPCWFSLLCTQHESAKHLTKQQQKNREFAFFRLKQMVMKQNESLPSIWSIGISNICRMPSSPSNGVCIQNAQHILKSSTFSPIRIEYLFKFVCVLFQLCEQRQSVLRSREKSRYISVIIGISIIIRTQPELWAELRLMTRNCCLICDASFKVF